jgi:hypothetical protein
VNRWIAAALTACALLALAPRANAQVSGQYTGAETLPVNGHLFGGYLNASQNVVGLTAQLRLSFYPNVDFGFQGGLNRLSYTGGDRTTLHLGVDFKFLARRGTDASPLDLSVGGELGVETGDSFSILGVGPDLLASLTPRSDGRSVVIPYAGIALLFSNVDVGPTQLSDFSVPLRLGAELRAIPDVRLTAELQLRLADDFNDDVGFAAGVNLPF